MNWGSMIEERPPLDMQSEVMHDSAIMCLVLGANPSGMQTSDKVCNLV